jgi:hypothetical protein
MTVRVRLVIGAVFALFLYDATAGAFLPVLQRR